MTEELPEGWAEATLGELVYYAGRIGWRGLKAEEYTKTGPLFISVHCLNSGKCVDFAFANHITDERYEESPEIKVQENDILITKDGAGGGADTLTDRCSVESFWQLVSSNRA